MAALVLRVAIIVAVLLVIWLGVRGVRRMVELRRRRALQAPPPVFALESGDSTALASDQTVRILAFSSADCAPCHRLQRPALLRVREARPDVRVVDIDAPSTPDLTARYHVLTVPTTVVLDAQGRAHAVNYGFASSQRLLEQIDSLLRVGAAAQPQPADA